MHLPTRQLVYQLSFGQLGGAHPASVVRLHGYYTPSQRGNYHHIMFRNPTAAVNLFHVGKLVSDALQSPEAAVTRNLIGRKIISNVKHADARNSLPILDVIRSSHKRHSASEYCKWTLRQTTGVCYTGIYVLGAPSHFPTEYRHEAAVVSREHRMKWVVILGDCYQWPLPWECTWVHADSRFLPYNLCCRLLFMKAVSRVREQNCMMFLKISFSWSL